MPAEGTEGTADTQDSSIASPEYEAYVSAQSAAQKAEQDLLTAQNNCSITSRGLYLSLIHI